MTWDQSVWGEVEPVPGKPATAGSSEKKILSQDQTPNPLSKGERFPNVLPFKILKKGRLSKCLCLDNLNEVLGGFSRPAWVSSQGC